MTSDLSTMPADRRMLLAGHDLGWLVALFLIVASAAPKLLGAAVATDMLASLGWPRAAALPIGLIELAGAILFVVPRTAMPGAILLTGLFGGAMATQFRVAAPLFSHELFGLYLGIAMWGSLWLRDAGLRRMLPLRR